MENFSLDNLKIGYFILYQSNNNFYGRIIERFQRKAGFSKEDSRYVHIEISLGETYSINAKFPKVRINKNILEKYKGRSIKIVKHKIEDYDEKRKNIAIICSNRVNKPYGIFGVLWFLVKDTFKRNFFSAFGDFCSELAGYGLWEYYINNRGYDYNKILSKPYNQLYPADFLDNKYFETVWEGNIPNE